MIMCSVCGLADSDSDADFRRYQRSFIDPGVVLIELRCCVSPGRCDGFIGC